MSDSTWYTVDEEKGFVLTEDAPEEAKESYEQYRRDRERHEKKGIR